jgi:hypothetical protein
MRQFDLLQEGRPCIREEIIELILETSPEAVTALRHVLAAQVDAQAEEEIDGAVVMANGMGTARRSRTSNCPLP